LANWFRNRTLHCAITRPLFLIAGIMFLFAENGTLAINARFVGPIVAIVTGIAFLVEWRGAPLAPLRRNAPGRSQWRPIFLFRLPALSGLRRHFEAGRVQPTRLSIESTSLDILV
jgi:hypothetical protein